MGSRKQPVTHWFGFAGSNCAPFGAAPFYSGTEADRQKIKQIVAGAGRARQRRYRAWKDWGEVVLIEGKNLLRLDPDIRREEILSRAREWVKRDACSDRWLEATIDHWLKKAKQKAQRFQQKQRPEPGELHYALGHSRQERIYQAASKGHHDRVSGRYGVTWRCDHSGFCDFVGLRAYGRMAACGRALRPNWEGIEARAAA